MWLFLIFWVGWLRKWLSWSISVVRFLRDMSVRFSIVISSSSVGDGRRRSDSVM